MAEWNGLVISAETVLRRTERGQQLVVFNATELPEPAQRLLLRLNGLTPLGLLLGRTESLDGLLQTAARLCTLGLAEWPRQTASPASPVEAVRQA